MEVMVPVMAPSAPCSPRTAAEHHHLPSYCYFFSSAPTSPTRASYSGEAEAAVGVGEGDGTFDFAFGFSGQLRESTPILAAADELFEGGRIRPLNTPHPSILQLVDDNAYTSPRSPGRRRRRIAAGEAAEVSSSSQRGRSSRAAPASSSSSSSSASSRSRRATRSLSPFRGGGGGGGGGGADDEYPSSPPSPRTSMIRGCGSGSRKWRLKDFFLFRSASEGRATGAGSKDPLLKYTMLSSSTSAAAAALHHNPQKLRGGDGSASMRKGRGSTASASDMPYTVSRAAAEEMRRRTTTPLPFHRNSLFGYLRSNPAIHSISRKLSGSNRGKPSA